MYAKETLIYGTENIRKYDKGSPAHGTDLDGSVKHWPLTPGPMYMSLVHVCSGLPDTHGCSVMAPVAAASMHRFVTARSPFDIVHWL